LSGVGSPSLGPTSNNQAQEKAKKLRFPLIHELAVRDQSFGDLIPKWEGETEAEFHTQLEKVAHFDAGLQKWTLKQQCWKELDVFAYPYEKEEDRQKAIDNAIRKYDRLRLGVSDPLWQKLLPVSERGKGICLSKVQAAIAKGPVAPAPKINVQAAEASSPSVDSEKEDSGSSSSKKPKVGGEPMARTNSGNKTKKMSEAQAQAKRLLSNRPSGTKAPSSKPTSKPSSAKTSPKVSPTKPTAKAATGKGGRVLSKEFISDSDSDSSEEAPLSKTTAASRKAQELKDIKTNPKVKPQPVERATERPKPAEKTRDVPAPKAKPAPAKSTPTPKIMDSIRAEGAKPVRVAKRSRDDDDDSSSSGTPLSKRLKNPEHVVKKAQPSEPKHRKSDSSQNSRGSHSSGTSSAKVKVSPVKSSPLASSPPTNASDIDAADERDTIMAVKKRKFESARPEKSHSDRYEKSDSSDSSLSKRAKHDNGMKVSKELREEAYRFKSYYARYEALHRELSALEDPPEDRLEQLLRMHRRLIDLKQQIREEVGYTSQ
jgi:RNA polymerase II elongation factor ELL